MGVPVFSDKRVKVVKGLFEDTITDIPLGFVHIDCDIYESTRTVLSNINVTKGTIILFDELWGYGDGPNEGAWRNHEWKALMEWGREWRFIGAQKPRAAIEIL